MKVIATVSITGDRARETFNNATLDRNGWPYWPMHATFRLRYKSKREPLFESDVAVIRVAKKGRNILLTGYCPHSHRVRDFNAAQIEQLQDARTLIWAPADVGEWLIRQCESP